MEDARFLVHDKRLSWVPDGGFRIMRSKFIRNVVEQNPEGSSRKVTAINSWQSDESDVVRIDTLAVKDRPEMVILQPRDKLAAGVYALEAVGGPLESMYVGGRHVFLPEGRERFCVDLIKTTAWGIPMGVKDRFIPCSSSPPVPSNAGQAAPAKDASTELAQMLEKWAKDPSMVDLQQVSALLAQGAKHDRPCDNGSVLRCAVLTRKAELVSALLKTGAKAREGEALVSHAARAGDVETVALLLNHRFSADESSPAICPPLFEANSENGVSIVKILIEHGANVNINGGFCGTPLTAAENENKTEIASILRRNGAKP